ncbi:MAG: hypothetical protein ACPL6C_01610 [bacterium]
MRYYEKNAYFINSAGFKMTYNQLIVLILASMGIIFIVNAILTGRQKFDESHV